MSFKATKKLLAKALEAQKAAPKPLLPKAGIVKKIALDLEKEKWDRTPVSVIADMLVNGVKETPVVSEPVQEKLRGYKIKQVNTIRVAPSAPSKMF